MKNIDVTVVGSLNYDIILDQKRLPNIGETLLVDDVTFSSGGKGANQAVQCAKLGLNTYMIGMTGNDFFGNQLLESLEKYQVNTDYVHQTNGKTGLGIVNSFPNGDVIANVFAGANYEMTSDYLEQVEEVMKRSKIVILQMEIPRNVVERAIQMAHESGCYVILNAAPSFDLSPEALRLVDCFIVNEEEANHYTNMKINDHKDAEKAVEFLFNQVQGMVIITLGAAGSILYDGKEKVSLPSYPAKVKETTGAGDSYVGAIAYGLMLELEIKELGFFASKASSITISKAGAQDSMPYLEEIQKLKNS